MAKITSRDIDEAVLEVRKKRNKVGEFFTEALEQSCEIAQTEIVKQIKAYDVIDKGTLMKSIEGKISGYSAEIYPQKKRVDAKHKKGERNETIAFVNEHGRKHKYYMAAKFNRRGIYLRDVKRRSTTEKSANAYKGRPFMETAYRESADKIEEAILDVLEGALNE